MNLEKPIDIQVFFVGEKTYKHFGVTEITRDNGMILLRTTKGGQVILVERNINQIIDITGGEVTK